MRFSTLAHPHRRDAQRRGALLSGATLLCLGAVFTLATPKASFAVDAMVSWRTVPQAAGYRVYVRPQGQAWGAGTDVGLPPADQLGVIGYVTRALQAGMVNEVVVAAYDASGQQSPFSNQLAINVPANTATPTRTFTPSPTATRTATRPPATATATRPPATATAPSTATRTFTPTPTRTPSSQPTATRTRGKARIRGRVSYYRTDIGVPQAQLGLASVEPWQVSMSDDLGNFAFDAASTETTWTLVPSKLGDVGDAVSALDAAYILQAAAGLRNLDPMQTLACDVTGNGTLSSLDAAQVLQYAVGARDRLPAADLCGSEWVFMPIADNATMHIPQLSGACSPGMIDFDPLMADAEQQNFVTSAFGDCTGNWAPRNAGVRSAAQAGLRQGAPPPVAALVPRTANMPYRYVVELTLGEVASLQALEASIVYDLYAAALVEVRAVGAARGAVLRHKDDGSGLVTLALATGEPIALDGGAVLQLVFQTGDESSPPHVILADTRVDDIHAEVQDQ